MVACLVMLIASAGCGSDDPGEPWPAVWGLEETSENFEIALLRIPARSGTPKVRLDWRWPDDDFSEEQGPALGTVRRFLTVQYAVTRNSPMHRNAYLYQFVATERMLHEMYPDGPLHPDHGPWHEGPVWIWLLYIEPAGEAAYQVGVCADIGWWERDTHLEHLPRADRALLREFRVVREVDDAGADRWKIDQEYSDADTRLDERWGEPCREWAVHTTEEPRE